jgi:hypothetical protein
MISSFKRNSLSQIESTNNPCAIGFLRWKAIQRMVALAEGARVRGRVYSRDLTDNTPLRSGKGSLDGGRVPAPLY